MFTKTDRLPFRDRTTAVVEGVHGTALDAPARRNLNPPPILAYELAIFAEAETLPRERLPKSLLHRR